MARYAKRMAQMEETASVIRSLFSAMTDPNIISFSGGAPAAEALPVEAVREISQEILRTPGKGVEALQYGGVMGYEPLREDVVTYLLRLKGLDVTHEQVLITSGGLEGLNLLCQVYIDPGDVILVESPTFVHAVEIFEMFGAKLIPVEMDGDGMRTDDLEAKIQAYDPKMVYVIPTFQNPTGITLSTERRKRIAELGGQYDVMILEDDPYRDIRYLGEDLPTIKSFDRTGHTLLANSFSKIFSPGSRLGYVVAEKEIMDKLFNAKSATNSHTAVLPQMIMSTFFREGRYPDHHARLCDLYRVRRDAMMRAIDRYFPEGTKRTDPDGGLFCWVELPEGIDTRTLLTEAVKSGVAYVAGAGFYAEGGDKGLNTMRLSFGGVTPDQIEVGMKRLGDLLKGQYK